MYTTANVKMRFPASGYEYPEEMEKRRVEEEKEEHIPPSGPADECVARDSSFSMGRAEDVIESPLALSGHEQPPAFCSLEQFDCTV